MESESNQVCRCRWRWHQDMVVSVRLQRLQNVTLSVEKIYPRIALWICKNVRITSIIFRSDLFLRSLWLDLRPHLNDSALVHWVTHLLYKDCDKSGKMSKWWSCRKRLGVCASIYEDFSYLHTDSSFMRCCWSIWPNALDEVSSQRHRSAILGLTVGEINIVL